MMEADLQQLELAIRQQRVITRLRLALEQVPNHPYHDDRKRLLLMLITAIDDQPNYINPQADIEQLETLVDEAQPAQVEAEVDEAQVEAQPAQVDEAQPATETQPAQDLRAIMKENHDPIA